MPGTDTPCIILSTASGENAEAIARTLVTERLAACVNMTPVRSMYHWKGEFCDDQEVLLVIKTLESEKGNVMARIRNLHGYELPEMLVLPVQGGYPPYLEWLAGETTR